VINYLFFLLVLWYLQVVEESDVVIFSVKPQVGRICFSEKLNSALNMFSMMIFCGYFRKVVIFYGLLIMLLMIISFGVCVV
jgi:hypothetical protein